LTETRQSQLCQSLTYLRHASWPVTFQLHHAIVCFFVFNSGLYQKYI